MKRTIGAVLVLALAVTLFALPAAQSAVSQGTTTATFQVRGEDLSEIQSKTTAILNGLDGSATWTVDYALRKGKSVASGGGNFTTVWIARATATAN